MNGPKAAAAHLHLGAFYFFYFASLGAFIPYWGLYLSAQGFSAKLIGLLTSFLLLTKIFAPYIWGWLADHKMSRLRVIRLGSLLSAVLFGFILFTDHAWQVALVILLFSFFWNAILPQFEVVTMMYLGDDTHYYSKIRLWGSVGFIVSSIVLSYGISWLGLPLFPLFVFALLILLWMDTLILIHVNEDVPSASRKNFWRHCASWPLISLLLLCFLAQASHGPYYAFFSLYLQQHGYPLSSIGIIWSIAVAAEIGVFLLVHRWLPVYGARYLLIVAVALTSVRWLLLAYTVSYWPVLVVSQLLHAASFGLFHAAAIHIIDQHFRGELRGRGQALYSSVSFGLGGAVGSVLAGLVWSDWGGRLLFLSASAVSLNALIQFLAAGKLAIRYNNRLF